MSKGMPIQARKVQIRGSVVVELASTEFLRVVKEKLLTLIFVKPKKGFFGRGPIYIGATPEVVYFTKSRDILNDLSPDIEASDCILRLVNWI